MKNGRMSNVFIPTDLHKKLKLLAVLKDMSIQTLMAQIIRKELDRGELEKHFRGNEQ